MLESEVESTQSTQYNSCTGLPFVNHVYSVQSGTRHTRLRHTRRIRHEYTQGCLQIKTLCPDVLIYVFCYSYVFGTSYYSFFFLHGRLLVIAYSSAPLPDTNSIFILEKGQFSAPLVQLLQSCLPCCSATGWLWASSLCIVYMCMQGVCGVSITSVQYAIMYGILGSNGILSAKMQILCCSFGLLLPVLLLILLRCHEVWVTVASPRECVAIQTQKLALPFLLLPAPA